MKTSCDTETKSIIETSGRVIFKEFVFVMDQVEPW